MRIQSAILSLFIAVSFVLYPPLADAKEMQFEQAILYTTKGTRTVPADKLWKITAVSTQGNGEICVLPPSGGSWLCVEGGKNFATPTWLPAGSKLKLDTPFGYQLAVSILEFNVVP